MNTPQEIPRSADAVCSPDSRREECPQVDAPPRSPGSRCPHCNGLGYDWYKSWFGHYTVKCSKCKGTGTAPSGDGARPANH